MHAVAFSPDGKRIVSVTRSVILWDATSGAKQLSWEYPWYPLAVGFSPDGSRVISASDRGEIHIWDAYSGTELLAIHDGGKESLQSVSFSPDMTHMVSRSDRTIRVFDIQSGSTVKLLHKIAAADNRQMSSVAISPNNMVIAWAQRPDNAIHLWDVNTGTELPVAFRGHTDSVNAIKFSPDGTRIASGSNNAIICVWEVSSGTELVPAVRASPSDYGAFLFYSPDGKSLISASSTWEKGAVRVSSLPTSSPELQGYSSSLEPSAFSRRSVTEPPGYNTFSAFSQDGTRLVAGTDMGVYHIWDVISGSEILPAL